MIHSTRGHGAQRLAGSHRVGKSDVILLVRLARHDSSHNIGTRGRGAPRGEKAEAETRERVHCSHLGTSPVHLISTSAPPASAAW